MIINQLFMVIVFPVTVQHGLRLAAIGDGDGDGDGVYMG